MILAALLVALGLLMGIVVTQARGLRMAGVLVVPLFVVYSLYDFYALPMAVISTAAAYAGLSLLKKRTFLYGRVLLLSSIAIGAIVPILSVLLLSTYTSGDPIYQQVVFLGSVLPGVAAYNYHRLDRSRRLEDIAITCSAFVGLFVLGATLVNPTVAASIGRLSPAVLFAPTADIAQFRGAALATAAPTGAVVGFEIAIALLLLGGVVSEAVYGQYGVRLNGLIAAPLLALLTLQNASVVPLYLVGTAAVSLFVWALNRQTLLYGRVLLSVAILASVLLAIPISFVESSSSGFVLLFLSILVGIGAYNIHRVSPPERATASVFSAALFVVSLAAMRALTPPLPNGGLETVGLAHVAVGAAICMAAGYRLLTLEFKRHRLTRRLTAEGVA